MFRDRDCTRTLGETARAGSPIWVHNDAFARTLGDSCRNDMRGYSSPPALGIALVSGLLGSAHSITRAVPVPPPLNQ